MEGCLYIEVILPIKLAWNPIYRVPGGILPDEGINIGDRVSVRLHGRLLSGVVSAILPPSGFAAGSNNGRGANNGADLANIGSNKIGNNKTIIEGKARELDFAKIHDIVSIDRHLEPVTSEEIRLWQFMAEYYLCTVGEVFKCAYPSGKVKSEQTAARVAARAEESAMRKSQERREKAGRAIERLHSRIEARVKALEGKHNEAVTARLNTELEALKTELAEAEAGLKALCEDKALKTLREDKTKKNDCQQTRTAIMAPEIAPEIKKLLNQDKPLLVRALDRSVLYQALEMECISRGRSVLHLVPDIAFTAELEDRMRTTFGGSLLLYHSRQTEASRRDTADALRHSSGPRVILGTRSAIFLPFKDLGLIIVDEEQDPSYKQDSPAPRYNTRDTAVVLAQIHACPLVLGSVTPSLETVHNCVSGRFKLWESDECRRLGEVTVIDTAAERRKRGMVGQFSRKLLAEIDSTLQSGGKVILLRGWGSTSDTAAEIAGIFAGCRVAHDESEGEWDILVGTIAGTKRMSLPGSCLLAFLQADTLLGAPDFRADERAMQVFDRFRLKCRNGRFIIQTSRSGHLLLQENASDDRYRWLLEERQAFGYPPYSRIVDIVLRDANKKRLEFMAGALGRSLSEAGFVPGRIDKTGRRDVADSRNIDVILRVPILRDKSFGVRKGEIRKLVEGFEVARHYSGFIHLDVDPQ